MIDKSFVSSGVSGDVRTTRYNQLEDGVIVFYARLTTPVESFLRHKSEDGWYNKFNKRNKRKNFKG